MLDQSQCVAAGCVHLLSPANVDAVTPTDCVSGRVCICADKGRTGTCNGEHAQGRECASKHATVLLARQFLEHFNGYKSFLLVHCYNSWQVSITNCQLVL